MSVMTSYTPIHRSHCLWPMMTGSRNWHVCSCCSVTFSVEVLCQELVSRPDELASNPYELDKCMHVVNMTQNACPRLTMLTVSWSLLFLWLNLFLMFIVTSEIGDQKHMTTTDLDTSWNIISHNCLFTFRNITFISMNVSSEYPGILSCTTSDYIQECRLY